MKNRHHGYAFLLIPIAVLSASDALSKSEDDAVTWRMDEADAAGTACSLADGDVQILTMGNDVSILATRLRVDLPAGDDSLVGLENCEVTIPATLLAGYVLDSITQQITYGVDKTSDTSAKVTATADFAGLASIEFTVDLPPGPLTEPERTDEKTSPFVADACGGALEGVFKANVAIGGEKGSTAESLLVGAIAPTDFRYDISLSSASCPPAP